MALAASGNIHQKLVADGVARATELLLPDVLRIRYNLAPDWTGDDGVFFRVLLEDFQQIPKAPRSCTPRLRHPLG